MKSFDSRECLIQDIEKFITGLSPKNQQKFEDEVLHDGKITIGNFLKIITGRYPLEELSDAELYWLLVAINRISSKVKKPEEYFEEFEIKNCKFYDEKEDKELKYPLVFKDVVKLAENQYLFPCSVAEIKTLKNANLLQIIPELQRNHKKDKYGDLKTKVNKATAQQISGLINKGEFFYNGIRFNLMDDGEADPPIFDEAKRTLTVTGGIIIVPDGNHRTIACELANKHLEDRFGVFFTYLSAPQTRLVLNQEWTTVPIPKQHREAMKPTNSNKIVDAIMRSSDADEIYVKGIVKDGSEIKSNNGFILYIELANAISNYYNADNLKSKADQDELKDWLITYMNYLTKLMYDDFSNFKKVKREKWSVHHLTWHYYIMISSIIKGSSDWRDELKRIIDDTDFSDQSIRDFFVANNRRKVYEFCKEREGEICIMLNRKIPS